MAIIFSMSSEPSFGEAHYISDRIALGLLPAWLTPLAPWLDRHLSTIVHLGEFGLLALLWANAFDHLPSLRPHALWLAWVVTVLYGASDEWHQRLVPGRSSTFRDWFTDILGATIALLLWSLWLRRR